jgi:hypothetical protein
MLDPSANPFTLLTRLADKRRTVATSYSHFEDRRKARFDTTSSTATTTIQTIPVTTGAYYAQWDLWQNTRTGEVFRVDGVAGNNITVTRNIAPSGVGTGTAMNSGDELMLVGTAQPENDTSKPARADVPTKVTNNTQIFRTPFEASTRSGPRASSSRLTSGRAGEDEGDRARAGHRVGAPVRQEVDDDAGFGARPYDGGDPGAHHDQPDRRGRRPERGGVERLHGHGLHGLDGRLERASCSWRRRRWCRR